MNTKQILIAGGLGLTAVCGLFADTHIFLITVHPYSFAATPPARASVPVGEPVVIQTEMNTTGQWFKNGRPIENATSRSLTVQPRDTADGGEYCFQEPGGRFTQSLKLNVGPEQRLLNISTRGQVGSGEQTLIVGFVVSGRSEKEILFRAVGPSLAPFGVNGFVREPVITIYDSKGQPYDNDYAYAAVVGVGKAEHIAGATKKTGAFALLANSKDAVDVRPFAPGAYTMHVTSKDGSAGIVLAEIYEVP